MDRLEEYIKKRRDSLDIREPSPDIWNKVRKELKADTKPIRRWLSIAAAVAVLAGLSALFYQIGRQNGSSDKIITEEKEPAKMQLKEAEVYYNNQINSLYREAEPLLTSNPELKKELKSDFSQIDSIYTDIRKDLKDNVANQEVVEALIQNYMIKIKILQDMLVILKENDNNTEKNKSHEL
jgi:hypothetical protein